MPAAIDYSGRRYGRLEAVSFAFTRRTPSGQPKNYWLCRCDCGEEVLVQTPALQRGACQSCGCLRREMVAAKNFRHGKSQTEEYKIWSDMKKRCANPRASHFAQYGGRGIQVCERWQSSFEAFLEDVGPRPSPDHSIDRTDNNGNYEPNNVRWATNAEQFGNMQKTVHLTIDGETRTCAEWCRLYGLHPTTLFDRLKKGWDAKRAVTTPPRKWPSQRR